MPSTAADVASVSASRPRESAAIVPMSSETATAMATAKTPMKSVFGSRVAISPAIGRPPAMVSDRPRSPCSALVSHEASWTSTGASRLCFRRKAAIASGVAFSPRIARAGSPGAAFMTRKTTMQPTMTVAAEVAKRAAIYLVRPMKRPSNGSYSRDVDLVHRLPSPGTPGKSNGPAPHPVSIPANWSP